MRWLKLSLVLMAATLNMATAFAAEKMPIADPNTIVAKYGKPDKFMSTEYDKPRPPIVTRILEYKKERVTLAFFPDVQLGTPPPYKTWRLLGARDPVADKPMSLAEAEQRLQGRLKNTKR